MSRKIDISNYEQYALDFLEGTLQPELASSFNAFLLAHPSIAEELEEMRSGLSLEPINEVSFDSSALKKSIEATESINEDNYEGLLIEEVEGTLDLKRRTELLLFLDRNEALKKEREIYLNTRLKANESVAFPLRSELKQAIPLWEASRFYALRIAAVLLVALGSLTAWNAINTEVYIPRDRALDYSFMDIPTRSESATGSNPVLMKASEESSSQARLAAVLPVRREAAPAVLPKKSPELLMDREARPDDRAMIAYQPRVSHWIEDDRPSQVEPLNLAQFIGKQFFGLDPQKTSTPKDLLREGVVKTIDDQESMALKTEMGDNNRRSFEFLAGNFEFKRVNYK